MSDTDPCDKVVLKLDFSGSAHDISRMLNAHVQRRTPWFSVLGPLQVREDDRAIGLGSRKQQIVLAVLLCHVNSPVSVESLIEALWGDEPPRTARKNIQVYVSGLRGLLTADGASRISFGPGGYVFHAHSSELDSLSFEEKALLGRKLRQARRPGAAAEALAAALHLWRGRPLDGLRSVPLIGVTAERFERQFLAVFEDWAEAATAAGDGAAAIERIREVVGEHPLRERLRTLQMIALCQAGRRSEALAVYDELRQLLAHDLGLSPSPAVTKLYHSLLNEQESHDLSWTVPSSRREAPPNLLPWDLPTFTGREESVRQLADALAHDGRRLAVVTGPLGAGKTALAVHVAHQLGDTFTDGRLFVRLRGADGTLRSVDDVVSELMWAVRPRHRRTPSPDGRRSWRMWLAEHRALVIIDDARAEPEVRPLLPESGDSRIVVTSRSRLAGLEGAYRLRVAAFAVTDALEYLGRVIGPERIEADRHSAERIVAAVGLLPLGLRLVAERLALLDHLPLREYAGRIARPAALLDELTAGDVGIRLWLAAAIAELPPRVRLAVPALGTLPSPVFTLSEAAAVLDADQDTTVRVLENLLEANIVTVLSVEKRAGTVLYELSILSYAYAGEMAAERSSPGNGT